MRASQAKTVKLDLSAHFVERYGADAHRIAEIVRELAAQGDRRGLEDLIEVFSAALAGANQVLRMSNRRTLDLEVL
ncbi:MAG: hypothetical protein ACE15E_00535 [Acidobacteriota bacterium]